MSIKTNFEKHILNLQDKICLEIENLDGKSRFKEDIWKRSEGGGGKTRIIKNGDVFEKGGVNTSIVFGVMPELMKKRLNTKYDNFYACGISIVLHPTNPNIPTIHANWRYFEMYDHKNNIKTSWFGGGTDLTPYYIDAKDIKHFHKTQKEVCDKFNLNFYPKFKKACDKYFYNSHRGEARGVGGIFFDYLKEDEENSTHDLLNFTIHSGNSFLNSYTPIVIKNKSKTYSIKEKKWQELRRGRYVEFNLLHDRGTHFGLQTNGRIESIFMSLPPLARWDYNHQTQHGSKEEKLIKILKTPIEWV